MREILFRGKRIDNGKWVCGYYVRLNGNKHFIYIGYAETDCGCYYPDYFEVIPETVGQYTGLNVGSEKLFEGDIVEWHEDYDDTWGYAQTAYGRSLVVWDKENFCWAFKTDDKYIQAFNDWNWNNSYIIGNIHDNPTLSYGGVIAERLKKETIRENMNGGND